MPQSISKIITHNQPHLDELVAIFLLKQYGERLFPGIRRAAIEFCRPESPAQGGKTAEEYEREGILLVGIGGGRFDEHATPGKERDVGKCATSLVAEAIKCSRRAELQSLIRYTTSNDLGGKVAGFELAEGVRVMNRLHSDDPQRVWRWTNEWLRAHHAQQQEFHQAAKRTFEADALAFELVFGEEKLKLASIQTDADQVKAYAFSRYGGFVAVVVQRNSRGNIQIFVNKFYGLDLVPVAAAVRLGELAARRRDPVIGTDYRVEGTVADVPEWYFFLEGQMLLNGSLTAPDVPPSALSLEEVTEIVRTAIRRSPSPEKV